MCVLGCQLLVRNSCTEEAILIHDRAHRDSFQCHTLAFCPAYVPASTGFGEGAGTYFDWYIILFRRHASDKFQEAISWSITWIFLLLISQVSYVVSDHFRWSYAPVHKKKKQLKMCLHFASNSHVAPMFKTRFLRRASVWNLWKLFHPVKQWLKQFLRDHWPFTQDQNR